MSKRQCKAFTKAGKPCQGGAKEGFEYCGPHLDQMENTTEQEMTLEDYDAQLWAEIREQFNCVVSGTGSRSLQRKPEEAKRVLPFLRQRLRELRRTHDGIVVMAGGAEGFDSALATAAKLEGIHYILALPSKDYGNYYWKRNSVTGVDRSEKFQEYIDGAYRVIYVCDDYRGHEPKRAGKANFDRNQYMVDHADLFFVYDPASSGTKDCLKRIQKAGLSYEVL